MVNFSLEGKVALVTGASYGIGFSIASAMGEAGAKIVFNDRNPELIEKGVAAYRELGIEAYGYICDVTDEPAVQAMVARIEKEVGVIDILVNNAGIIKRISMVEMSAEDFRQVAEPMGHRVDNYGMYAADDEAQLTYVQCGILGGILLNSGAADFVVTGCGTGEGAMLAMNSFPGVICGHVEDPVDAYTFAHVNDGNAVAMPFAKGFGWGGELNLEYVFEKLLGFGHGQGYPPERVEPEMRNKRILDQVRSKTLRPLLDGLKDLDQELVKGAVAGRHFRKRPRYQAVSGILNII